MKNFLVIGSMNAVTYRDTFVHIKNNELWLGVNSIKKFQYEDEFFTFGNIYWYTNMWNVKRSNFIPLKESYKEGKYPKYDNFDAIDVSSLKMIPKDYNGIIGVPITFYLVYNPDQFDIVWHANGNTNSNCPKEVAKEIGYEPLKKDKGGCGVVNGELVYSRVLIKHKKN